MVIDKQTHALGYRRVAAAFRLIGLIIIRNYALVSRSAGTSGFCKS